MKSFLKKLIAVTAPVAIQAVEGVAKGNPALNMATSIVQGVLMQVAGTNGISHEDASDTAVIKQQVQAMFDAMKAAGLVKPIAEVKPIVEPK